MSEPQNPIQTIYFSADPNQNNKISQKILKALEPVVRPSYYELAVRPKDATIPVLQALFDAPRILFTDFQKYYNANSHLVLFVSNDLEGLGVKKTRLSVLKIATNEVSLFFATRTKKTIYKYILTYDEVRRIFDTKSLKMHSSYNAQKIHIDNDDDEIVSKFFGLYMYLWRTTEFENYYMAEVYDIKRLHFWTEPTNELKISDATVRKFRGVDGIYYIESEKEFILFDKYKIESGGRYILALKDFVGHDNSETEDSNENYNERSDVYCSSIDSSQPCYDPESCY